jgi:hypothetical protein
MAEMYKNPIGPDLVAGNVPNRGDYVATTPHAIPSNNPQAGPGKILDDEGVAELRRTHRGALLARFPGTDPDMLSDADIRDWHAGVAISPYARFAGLPVGQAPAAGPALSPIPAQAASISGHTTSLQGVEPTTRVDGRVPGGARQP